MGWLLRFAGFFAFIALSAGLEECAVGQFLCHTRDRCIDIGDLCNGVNECSDGSDEIEADCALKCLDGQTKCADGLECYVTVFKCDTYADCKDGSDEANCPSTVSPPVVTCPNDEFMCNDGRCISRSVVCDKLEQCPDGADEENCSYPTDVTTPAPTTPDPYLGCLDQEKICDGNRDCPDGSDESICHDCSPTNVCKGANEECKAKPGGNKCVCKLGFLPGESGCVDQDECALDGVCSQKCINTEGSYYCECADGYTMMNDKSCEANGPPGYLYYVHNRAIRRLSTNGQHVEVMIPDAGDPEAIAFDYEKDSLYWSNNDRKVYLSSLSTRSTKANATVVIGSDLGRVEGMALDWRNQKLFIADSGKDRIEVYDIVTKERKTLVTDGLDELRGIAVNPLESPPRLYWCDWGEHKIESSLTDGTDRRTLYSDPQSIPSHLTIDYPNNRLYWVDAKYQTVMSSNLDGTDRKVIRGSGIKHPFGITIFEDNLFYTDWVEYAIVRVNRPGGEQKLALLSGLNNGVPKDIKAVHPVRQPTDNPVLPPTKPPAVTTPRTTPNQGGNEGQTDNNSNIAVIAGGASAGIVFLAVIIILIIVFVKRQDKRKEVTFDNPLYYNKSIEPTKSSEKPTSNGSVGEKNLPDGTSV